MLVRMIVMVCLCVVVMCWWFIIYVISVIDSGVVFVINVVMWVVDVILLLVEVMKKNGMLLFVNIISVLSGFICCSIGQWEGRNGNSNMVGRLNWMSVMLVGVSGEVLIVWIDSVNLVQMSIVSIIVVYLISGLVWKVFCFVCVFMFIVNVELCMLLFLILEWRQNVLV